MAQYQEFPREVHLMVWDQVLSYLKNYGNSFFLSDLDQFQL